MNIRRIILSTVIFAGSLLVNNSAHAMERTKKRKAVSQKVEEAVEEKNITLSKKTNDQPVQAQSNKTQDDKVSVSEQPHVADPVQEVKQSIVQVLVDPTETKLLPSEGVQALYQKFASRAAENKLSEANNIFSYPADGSLEAIEHYGLIQHCSFGDLVRSMGEFCDEKELNIIAFLWVQENGEVGFKSFTGSMFFSNIYAVTSFYEFLHPIISYLADSLKIKDVGVYFVVKESTSLPMIYYQAMAVTRKKSLLIGKAFIQNLFFTDIYQVTKQEKLEYFIFAIAHELGHLTEENQQKSSEHAQEFHADEVAVRKLFELFSSFKAERFLLLDVSAKAMNDQMSEPGKKKYQMLKKERLRQGLGTSHPTTSERVVAAEKILAELQAQKAAQS